GPRADVFALGAIFFECLAGRPAFAGESAFELLTKVDRGDHPRLRSLRPDAPTWLDAVIERALAVEPGRRFASARELAAALRAPERSGRRTWLAAAPVAVAAIVAGSWLLATRGTPAPPMPAPKAAATASQA